MTQASDRIEAQAAEWLIRADLSGTPEKWSALDGWLASNPRHRAAFLRLSTSWRSADRLRSLRAFDGEVDEDLLSPQALRARRAATRAPKWRPAWAFGLRAAAAAVAIVALGAIVQLAIGHFDVEVYTTAIRDQEHIQLADGSTVQLNTQSELQVRYTNGRRELTLVRGEAAFDVAPDPERPFEVQAASTMVRALGTAFSVRLHESRNVDVRVTEGRVAIDRPSAHWLGAGDTAAVTSSGRVVVKKVPVELLTNKLAWTQGRLFFNGETLAQAVAEFNRYNYRQLVIVDPRIAGERILGTFGAKDLEKFAASLEESFEIRILPALPGAGSRVLRLHGKDP